MDMDTDHECKSACTYTQIEIGRQLSKNDRLMAVPKNNLISGFTAALDRAGLRPVTPRHRSAESCFASPIAGLVRPPMQRGLVLANLIYILQMEGI